MLSLENIARDWPDDQETGETGSTTHIEALSEVLGSHAVFGDVGKLPGVAVPLLGKLGGEATLHRVVLEGPRLHGAVELRRRRNGQE
jgi:hypothetical protein